VVPYTTSVDVTVVQADSFLQELWDITLSSFYRTCRLLPTTYGGCPSRRTNSILHVRISQRLRFPW